ncbi:hypothetical protein VT84_34610 [Gemmata sp. SH-PL17]|uniref:hypothetical protein n=1 Tax=Gemmata sp. SH-PL17 TaxID=1630693 RepID=UPI0004B52816|nr:hypothetical protein [Gemmata sp. SH-PL17]AMV29579.1 hypothetical protein VT84_34610 [Gemmata sp. SH-PL17]
MVRFSRLGLAALFAATLAAPVARAAEPDKLLPAEADTVAYINFKQILESDIVKKYALDQIKQALAGQDAKKFLEEIGLDPMKDVEKVWVGMSGSTPDDTKALLIIHGTFDPEKLFKAASAITKKDGDKFSMVKDGNVTMFKYQPDQGNPVYGTVVDDTTVIAGTDKKLIANALKQSEEKKKAPIKAELTDLVKQQDEKASLFVASLVKGKLDNVNLPAQSPIDLSGIAKGLPKTNTLSFVIRATADVNLEVTFGMKDEEAASDMGDAVAKLVKDIEGFVPALVAFEPKAKQLGEILKTVKSDVKKSNVTLSGKVAGTIIGKLVTPEG